MTYKDAVPQVSQALGLPPTLVDKVYRAYWKTIQRYVTSLPLMEDLTDEQFLELRPNVNIPSIGKFYITPERYRRLKNKDKEIKSRQ